ncbi:NAD-dependent epimerase/dehydratase family protein [Chitinophaga pollutisoli]|uniref:NAD-dependent epimerase/dehydratase family protein n=1 Tax=Chitinophaga pollutisoli TaxID=3133966 RepID=A0ABZ2YNP8_9BACT
MALHTLLGANGTIANALLPVLQSAGHQVRLVSRNPQPVEGVESIAADVLHHDQVLRAVQGSDVVYLLVGIQYNAAIWERDWPRIMRSVIDACKASGSRLIFFDNAYMYGKSDGEITETTPYRPVSRKGKVRAGVARMLEAEMRAGAIDAIIARAVDFYGPGVSDKSAAGVLVFANMKKGRKAQWFINADVPRSYNYTPDAARALYLLSQSEEALGQIWHLPAVSPALTGRQFISLAAKEMGAKDGVFVLPKWLLKVFGWFNPFMREMFEMHYQDEFPFRFNSSRFEKHFHFTPTRYEDGVKATAQWFLQQP